MICLECGGRLVENMPEQYHCKKCGGKYEQLNIFDFPEVCENMRFEDMTPAQRREYGFIKLTPKELKRINRGRVHEWEEVAKRTGQGIRKEIVQ